MINSCGVAELREECSLLRFRDAAGGTQNRKLIRVLLTASYWEPDQLSDRMTVGAQICHNLAFKAERENKIFSCIPLFFRRKVFQNPSTQPHMRRFLYV